MKNQLSAERLRLKITLEGSDPPIWRRVEVNSDLTFLQLHRVIQQAMGWEGHHAHEFDVARTRIGPSGPDDSPFMDNDDVVPEHSARLFEWLEGRQKFRYWYDFGDDWWHQVVVEKRLPPDAAAKSVILLDGARACPPEDCGGIPGYYGLLEILADPTHGEREHFLQWLGGTFDPEAFDLAAQARKVAGVVRGPRRAKKGDAG
ncbi:hypothetical protein B566_EDAN003248 [Ephemera danica]|nr:hypothetical protein B566_EDAN003248 [Ephemera danica]